MINVVPVLTILVWVTPPSPHRDIVEDTWAIIQLRVAYLPGQTLVHLVSNTCWSKIIERWLAEFLLNTQGFRNITVIFIAGPAGNVESVMMGEECSAHPRYDWQSCSTSGRFLQVFMEHDVLHCGLRNTVCSLSKSFVGLPVLWDASTFPRRASLCLTRVSSLLKKQQRGHTENEVWSA